MSGNSSNNNSFVIPNMTNFITMKLNGENFLCWKHQLLNVFKTLGLEKHVDRSYVPPSTPPECVERWKKEDSFVSVCINATLDVSLAHLAIDTKSACDLWKVIEDTYLQQAYAKKSQLKTEFQNIKQGNNSVSTYCDSIKHICDALRSIGENVTESDLVLQTLLGLNTSYNMFVLNVENSEVQPTFAQLRSRLLLYEQRMNHQQSESITVSAMAALKVGDTFPNSNLKESQNNTSCQICRKQGHLADKCYYRYSSDNSHGRGNTERWNDNFRGRGLRGNGRFSGGGRFRGNRVGNRNGFSRYAGSSNFQSGSNFQNGPSGYFVGTESGLTFAPNDPAFSQSYYGPENNNSPHWMNYNSPSYGSHASGQQSVSNNSNSGFGNMSGQFSQAYTADFGPAHFAKWSKQHGTSANLTFSDTCAMVDSWIPDSGATTHMTPNPDLVEGAVAYNGPERVVVDSHGDFTPPHPA